MGAFNFGSFLSSEDLALAIALVSRWVCAAMACAKSVGEKLTRPEKSLQCGRIILPQVYTLFLILNTVYICFGDETDVSNAGEQLARDKSPGDDWDSAFFIGLL